MRKIFETPNFEFIKSFPVSILALSILASQIIKFPSIKGAGVSILDITIVILTITGIFKLRFKLKKPPLFLQFFSLFLLISAFSALFSPLTLTIEEKITGLLYLLRIFFYFLFSLVIYTNSDKKFLKNLAGFWFFIAIVLSILGIIQITLLPDLRIFENFGWDPHYFRIVSTFLDPNFLATFLTLCVIPNLDKKNIFTLLIFIAIIGTFSRSGLLLFFLCLGLLSFLKKSSKFIFLSVSLISIFTLIYFLYNNFVAGPNNIDRKLSANLRINSWSQGLYIFNKHPFLGVGFNNYRYALETYNLSPKKIIEGRAAAGNDSSLLFVAATTGVLGLATFLLFYFSLIYDSLKNLKSNFFQKAYFACIVGLLINSFFINSLFYPPILLWILLSGIYTSSKTSS